MQPLIINAAISGSHKPGSSPHLARNPEEVGLQALECVRAGASIIHIHARDDEGRQSGDLEHFQRTVDVIRNEAPETIVNLTTSFTSSSEAPDSEVRMSVLEAAPEIASYDAGTMNFSSWVFRNDPAFLRELATRMNERDVKPEIEVFDEGMLGTVERLVEEGYLKGPLFIQFVMGVAGGVRATAANLTHLVQGLPEGATWSVAAVGRHQLNFNAMAIAMGGHARTGLEDNLYFSKGVFATNAQLVSRVRDLAGLMGREVATPHLARELLAIRPA